MSEERVGYKVTLKPIDGRSVEAGIATIYVASEDRAKELVAPQPAHRSYRAVPWGEIPEEIRFPLEEDERGKA